MMLDHKAPRFSMRGQLADIVPAAYEVKRRRLLAAHLARKARRAQQLTAVVLLVLLALAACAPKLASSLSRTDAEPAAPHARHHATDWYSPDAD